MTVSRRRRLLPLAVGLTGTVLLAAFWASQRQTGPAGGWAAAPPEVRASLWPEPREIVARDLIDQHGRAFDPAVLHGRWSFVFFGYLQCPDVCPMTLLALRDLRRAMIARDPDATRHRFIFVTLDPEHDTPADIASYLGFYDEDFIGLSGSMEAIDALGRSLMVMRIETTNEDGLRELSHTSSVMVLGPDGRAVGALSAPHNPQNMLERFDRLRRWLGG